jgi:hypothetical protein
MIWALFAVAMTDFLSFSAHLPQSHYLMDGKMLVLATLEASDRPPMLFIFG